jgi:hypothetical protein
MMMMNESKWIRLHLPVFLKSDSIAGICAVDGGSTDGGAEYIRSLGGIVEYRQWDWRPLEQENAVIDLAERSGFDAMLLTAPDELWWPHHLDEMKQLLQERKHALSFPTFNFVRNRRHWAPNKPYYPDMHIRAWRLNEGIRHEGALDSVANVDYKRVTRCMTMPMYHFSHIKPRDWYKLKEINFHRVRDGLPPLDALPDGVAPEPYPEHVPFPGMQPLDPDECGENAPF